MKRIVLIWLAVWAILLLQIPSSTAQVPVTATVETDPVVGSGDAADDPAIWIHPTDPSLSTIIGTDKTGGGLAVYDLAGHQLQFDGTVKPNNVDLRYGFPLGGGSVDLVAFTDQSEGSIGTYAVDPVTRRVTNVAAREVETTVPTHGLCMYHSPLTGKYYAFAVAGNGRVEQWELLDDGTGRVDGALVRSFVIETATGTDDVGEGCTVDDTYAALYLSSEREGVWRYGAEPTAGDARTLVDAVGSGHLHPDIEGLAVYPTSSADGYLIASSQGSDDYALYDRQTNQYLGSFAIVAGAVDGTSHTDGIEVTNVALGSSFPEGVFVAQDDENTGGNQNFKLVPWGSVARAFAPPLAIDTTFDPRSGTGGGGGNRPPIVSAGPDLTVQPSQGAVLDGSVSDDGLPGGPLTTGWTAIEGPGGATVSFEDASAVDTTATFSALGTYVLRLSADDGELASSDTATVVVTDTTTVEVPVRASSDDAEESSSGSVSLTSSDLELVTDGSAQTVGLRFTGLPIPRAATIVGAYVQFQTDEVTTAATSLNVRGQAADSAAAFTTASRNVSGRPRTGASVAWTLAPWSTVGERGPNQRTPDLSPVIQEIVNRPGWASGNALALIVTGTGKRTAEAFDGSAAPLLHVEFRVGGPPPNLAPSVDAGSDQTIALSSQATLNGSVTDDGFPDPPGATTTEWSQVSDPGTATFADDAAATTTVGFSDPGTYVLQLLADDGELTASDTVTVVVTDTITLERRVAAGNDDAEESASGNVSRTGSDLELVNDGNNQTVGLRFSGLAIPPGATIVNAYVRFTVDETSSGSIALAIDGQAADNAGAFTTSRRSISSRTRTAARVAWSPPAWTTVGAAGDDQRTPNLAPIIQEIVNRTGWTTGNAIVLILTGTGRRVAESYEGSRTAAALLHVEYR